MTTARPEIDRASFRHEAFLYGGLDDFLRGTAAFVRDANDAGEPVLVVVDEQKTAALRDELGGDGCTHFADMADVGHNPAWIIPAWHEFLERHAGGNVPVRGISEPVWVGRSAPEIVECQRHEELLNVAFNGGRPWWLLCPYDLATLDDDVVTAAGRSHPFVLHDGVHRASPDVLDLESMAGPFDAPLSAPPPRVPVVSFNSPEALHDVREVVMKHAVAAGLGPTRAQALVLAANEIASNSLRHGGGAGTLAVWPTASGAACEIRDQGTIADPLVGRRLPPAGRTHGRGVWIANRLCDLVQIRSNAQGTTVRLHVQRV
jgi:anti-sigma regulatory factor (Ser/Thr protein kinase)